MAHLRKMLCFAFIGLICLGRSGFVIAEDNDGLSSKIDSDIFLEDEGSGMGSRGMDDLEMVGSGNGDDDEDTPPVRVTPPPIRTTPKSVSVPNDITGGNVKPVGGGDKDINFPPNGEPDIFDHKEESPPASFFSQPGILAAIICGAIVGLLCAILMVMFIVYRMRKRDEGSYVLDDSRRTTPAYGKSKEFFA